MTTALVDSATATVGTDPAMCTGSATGGLNRAVWYTFTPPTTAVYRIEQCGAAGLVGTNTDTVISVLSGACGSLSQLPSACNDDQGGSAPYPACSLASGTQALLTAGVEYKIQLAGWSTTPTGTIGVRIDQVGQPPANDTCGGAIALSTTLPTTATVVDLNTATTAGDAPMSCTASTAYSSTAMSRGVWYTFTPATTGGYRFDLCPFPGSQGTLSDTAISVYTASGCAGPFTEVTGACSQSFCGQGGASFVTLTAGTTYYVQVAHGSNNAPAAGLGLAQLQVSARAAPSNDVCTAAVPVALNSPTPGTLIFATPNYQLDGGAQPGTVGNTSTSALGRDVVYSFTAGSAGLYSFRVLSLRGNGDSVVYLNETCSPSDGMVTGVLDAGFANRNSSATLSEEAACVPLNSGQTVFAYVDQTTVANPGSDFELEVNSCTYELENNNDNTTVTQPLSCGIQGSISPASEFDHFSVGTPAVDSRFFAMVDTAAASSTAFSMRLISGGPTTGQIIEYDNGNNDTRFGASGSNIGGARTPAVPLWLQVRSTTASDGYRIYSVLQPPATDAVTEDDVAHPNNTRASAWGGLKNYFAGAISTYTDEDYYAFTARPGDLVYVGLDGDPTRTTTPSVFDGVVGLYDHSGNLLVEVDDTSTTTSMTASTAVTTGTSPNAPGEGLWYRVRTDGTYYVRVSSGGTTSTSTGATGDYLLSISIDCTTGRGIVAPTSVTGFTPTVGSTLGGTVITVTGADFVAGARVRVGGNYAVSTTFVDSNTLTAIVPPGTAGAATVEVVHPGNQAVAAPGSFTYGPAPTVATVAPLQGTTLGGTPFTIAGADFNYPPVSVTFGTATVTTFTVDSATQISGVTPAHSAGAVPVTVTTQWGSFTKTNAFTYVAPPNITSLSPASGPTAGGNTVAINGSGFTTATEIKLDGVVIPQNASGTASQIFFTAPAHAAGAVSIQVTNTDGQTQTIPNAYTYVAPPNITAINPPTGATTGNEVVTITGTDFLSGATVTFDTDPATNVTVTGGGTTITATTPGHPAGIVTVTVTNPDSQLDTVSFEYVAALPPPVLTSITPDAGTTYGGTVVTLSGSGFLTGASVTFDGVPATGVSVDVPNQTVTATTPAHVFGAVDVVLTNPDNQLSTLTGGYTYVAPAPTLATNAVSPASGRTTTTTNITITGDEFLPGATVTIGGAACTSLVRVSKTTLTCTAPTHAAGFVSVTVTNPDGKTVTQTDAFEYVPAPTVVGPVAPNNGPTAGGTNVVITGTGFRTGATVRFGTVASPTVTVDSATQITAVSPAAAAGTVSITVTNTDTQAATLANAFTYYARPTVTAISPAQGYAVGGTSVTITGTAFRTGATVSFIVGANEVAATNVTFVSATTITARTPAQTPGLADVKVTNTDGQTFTLPGAFRFVAAPTLASVTPNHGAATGGTRLTLVGTNILPGATIVLGGSPAVAVAVDPAGTSAGATTTPHDPGVVSVVLTNPDGQTVTLANGYTFDEAPALTAVDPNVGPTTGGNTVTLTGTGFQTGATVVFGTSSATVTNVTATTITVTAPARPAGVVLVRVTNTDGQSSQLTNAYRYVSPPTLTAINPATGPDTGGTRVTITGTGLVAGTTVTFGGTAATDVVVLNATSLQANSPPHASGAVDVVVTTPANGTATLANGFTYEATAPTLTQVAPATGSTEGGTVITLTGTGFLTGATVKIGGADATSVVVVSSTLIRATTPAHAPGAVEIDVFNTNGLNARLSNAYTYVTPASPTEGRVTDGGTGGVTDTTGGEPDIIRPAPACGCNAGGLNALALLGLAALFTFRRRKA